MYVRDPPTHGRYVVEVLGGPLMTARTALKSMQFTFWGQSLVACLLPEVRYQKHPPADRLRTLIQNQAL